MPSHIYICMCDVFCVLYVFFVLCLITKVLYRSIMALLWNRGGVTIFLARQIFAKFLLLPRWT